MTTASFTLNPNRGITLGSTGGTIDPAGSTTLTYNGIVAGTGGLGPKTQGGTLVLGGVNTYSGTTIVSAGTLQDGIANALPATTTLTVKGTGTFDLGGFAQTVAGLADGGVSTGTVTDSGATATFTVNAAGAYSFSGLLSGTLTLTKTGLGGSRCPTPIPTGASPRSVPARSASRPTTTSAPPRVRRPPAR